MKSFKILMLFFLYSASAECQTFHTAVNLAIPGAYTTSQDLVVSGLSSIIDENFGVEEVCIDITHPGDGDLTMYLIAPDSTRVLLSQKNGGLGDNYTNTCFNGVSSTSIANGTAPFNGDFLPEQSLGLLNDGTINPNGDWQFEITSDFFFRNGTLNSISITFGNNPAISSSDNCLVKYGYDSGQGSLRFCIDTVTVGEMITFSSYIFANTVFLSSAIVIDKDMTIFVNLDQQIFVDGTSLSNTLTIAPGATVNLVGLKIFGGNGPKGVVWNQGSLLLDDVEISGDETPGAIFSNDGILEMMGGSSILITP